MNFYKKKLFNIIRFFGHIDRIIKNNMAISDSFVLNIVVCIYM